VTVSLSQTIQRAVFAITRATPMRYHNTAGLSRTLVDVVVVAVPGHPTLPFQSCNNFAAIGLDDPASATDPTAA
jgi:hypothetical protein